MKGSSIVGDKSFVEACSITMRYIQILKDKSMNIVASKGYPLHNPNPITLILSSDPSRVQEIVPYMISVLWGGKKCNIQSINELHQMMTWYFGSGVGQCIQKAHEVDKELMACFANLMP